jgi:hypothetical protein
MWGGKAEQGYNHAIQTICIEVGWAWKAQQAITMQYKPFVLKLDGHDTYS